MLLRLTIAIAIACIALPRPAALSETPQVARVGFVWVSGASDAPDGINQMWERLRSLGWEEGRNLMLERRWAEGRMERLPALMFDLVARKVDVIVTASTPAAIAAKKATDVIPIVVGAIGDPVDAGLARSLARPGGNLTGISYGFSDRFAGKWLELLRECVPQLRTVALVYNPNSPWSLQQRKELEASVAALGLNIYLVEVTNPDSLKGGFAQLRRHAQGVVIVADPFTYHSRREIAALAMHQRSPSVASMLEFVDTGALLSYGVDNDAVFRRMAEYVDKILRGAKPGDLPIEEPTQLTLAVNLNTAALLGLTVPTLLLERADRVVR